MLQCGVDDVRPRSIFDDWKYLSEVITKKRWYSTDYVVVPSEIFQLMSMAS